MMDITEIWVNAALKLSDKDIHIMNRIVRSQIRQNEMKADSHSSQHLASELIAA
jgi:hypothetical protein